MKRQNIRKLLLIISMLLFPITIWYMSPYLIIQGALPLFLLDGTIYGHRNQNQTFATFTRNTYCVREREMYFL